MAALNGLDWGATSEEVLAHQRELIMDHYRTDIAGIRDPIEIDRMRRDAEDDYLQIESSYVEFDANRTGFEVSVIQDEVRAGAGHALLSVRDDWSTYYFVFLDDTLRKMVVTYDQASMGFVGFEAFVERLESALGGPTATDWEVDDIGVRQMTRATWEDEAARVRAEDKSEMFASFLLVYADPTLVEEAPAEREIGRTVRPAGTRDIGAMIRRIDENADEETRDNSDVVDELLGSRTEVEIQLPADAVLNAEPTEGEASGPTVSAMDDDEELEDAERLERRDRPSRNDDDEEEEETVEDDGGEIIY